jgi:hypothetical protein
MMTDDHTDDSNINNDSKKQKNFPLELSSDVVLLFFHVIQYGNTQSFSVY